MKSRKKHLEYIGIAFLLSITLGLAPFKPEPHLVGKVRWLMGGGEGMGFMDYLDFIFHALPWMALISLIAKFFRKG